jgi:hypothetical protein
MVYRHPVGLEIVSVTAAGLACVIEECIFEHEILLGGIQKGKLRIGYVHGGCAILEIEVVEKPLPCYIRA